MRWGRLHRGCGIREICRSIHGFQSTAHHPPGATLFSGSDRTEQMMWCSRKSQADLQEIQTKEIKSDYRNITHTHKEREKKLFILYKSKFLESHTSLCVYHKRDMPLTQNLTM